MCAQTHRLKHTSHKPVKNSKHKSNIVMIMHVGEREAPSSRVSLSLWCRSEISIPQGALQSVQWMMLSVIGPLIQVRIRS